MSDRGGRFFLDTNIFLYRFDERNRAKALIAETLVVEAIASRSGVISYQVIQEFINISLKRLSPALTTPQLERHLTYTFLPLHIVHSSTAMVVEALHLRERYRLPWYDSLIVAAALHAQCDRLLTEDLQHGQKFGRLNVENPFIAI